MSAHSALGAWFERRWSIAKCLPALEPLGGAGLAGEVRRTASFIFVSRSPPHSCQLSSVGGHSVCRVPPSGIASACRPASRSPRTPVARLPEPQASAGRTVFDGALKPPSLGQDTRRRSDRMASGQGVKRRRDSRLSDDAISPGRHRPILHLRDGIGSTSKARRSEEHTSELQSLMRISYAVFCLKNKTKQPKQVNDT